MSTQSFASFQLSLAAYLTLAVPGSANESANQVDPYRPRIAGFPEKRRLLRHGLVDARQRILGSSPCVPDRQIRV